MTPAKKTDPEEEAVEVEDVEEEAAPAEPVETPLERELRMAKAAGKPKERIAAIEAAIKAEK
jgi:hypothetical protein